MFSKNLQHYRDLGIEYPSTSGIYMAKNLLDNKVYVGSAYNLKKRINNHMWNISKSLHRNVHFQNAVNKYGWDNFYFIILEECEVENIIEREQFWIDYYQSYKRENGYNKQQFAYSNKGNKLSDETKAKISKAFKGKPKSEEHNLKNSLAKRGPLNPNYGKPISEKVRQAIIESNKRRKLLKDEALRNSEHASGS